MTLEELKKYSDLKAEIRALEIHKRTLYRPIHSPVSDGGSYSTTPGDPTAAAVDKIMKVEQMIDQKLNETTDRVVEINQWMKTINDPQVEAIITLHFLSDLSWNQTAKMIYPTMTGDACRKIVKRYFISNASKN